MSAACLWEARRERLEADVIKAALALSDHTNSHSFALCIEGTTPVLQVAMQVHDPSVNPFTGTRAAPAQGALTDAEIEYIASHMGTRARRQHVRMLDFARIIEQRVRGQVSDVADAAPKLAHGHRGDWYLMANARRVAIYPIYQVVRMTNAHFARELFATGSTSAHQICVDAGIDPDGYTVERKVAAMQAQAGETKGGA